MPENDVVPSHMQVLPTELLMHLFTFLEAKDLMRCRQVCTRWKIIIDGYARSEMLWGQFCKNDFKSCYWKAVVKAKPGFSFYNLYRTLSSWPKLAYAAEECDEFASASRFLDEIRSLDIIGNNSIAVHKKGEVEYYDIATQKPSKRGAINGDYARFQENADYIVIQSYHLQLFVINKLLQNDVGEPTSASFDNVKMFLLLDTELYLVKLNDEIHYSDLRKDPMTTEFIKRVEDIDGVMALGYSDGCLNILTYQRKIYTIVNNKDMVFKTCLNTEPNILHVLNKYNFLEQLDWRVYFQWMYVLNHPLPEGPMRDIITIKRYGNDVYFVGSNFGVLCIFYKPYINGELDLFNSEPLRQINFMERSDIPVLATCPILSIDCQETRNGHTVYVAMPKKVAVLRYTYNFLKPAPWVMLPLHHIPGQTHYTQGTQT